MNTTANNTTTDQQTVSAIYTMSNEQREALVTIIEAHMDEVEDAALLSLVTINSDASDTINNQLESLKAGDYVGLELVTYMRTDMEMTHRDFDFL